MMALEASRQQQQQFPFFSNDQIAVDPELMDPYGFSTMQSAHHNQQHPQEHVQSFSQQTYYDTSASWAEQTAEMEFQQKQQQEMLFTAGPNSPPSMAASHYSAASAPSIASASSSNVGSPYVGSSHNLADSWIDTSNGLLGVPMALMPEMGYSMASIEVDPTYGTAAKFPTVDPSAIHHPIPASMPYEEHSMSLANSSGFVSPAQMGSPMMSHQNLGMAQIPPPQMNTSSPYLGVDQAQPSSAAGSVYERPSSIISSLSPHSHPSPSASNTDAEDDGREKRRCPRPDCGRSFKDLRAHMLTHQSERPEKCPIVNCEYHLKGFARKYDKNRHTLTHYKGTMVCGFCPGSGSAAEKSFNRADVFKRHLMSVHGVEQTAPNCRKRSPTSSSATSSSSSSSAIPSSSLSSTTGPAADQQKLLSGYSEDATGKCSTCSARFSNAQDFYEHLDECVLRVVQQEEPSEAINQQRLAEVANDEDVKLTMEKHNLLDIASPVGSGRIVDEYHTNDDEDDNDEHEEDGENDADADDDNDNNNDTNVNTSKPNTNNTSGRGAISKQNSHQKSSSRVVLGAKSAVSKNSSSSSNSNNSNNNRPRPITRRRGNRNSYPHSWGTPAAKMKRKKRVICAYDGSRRLWKDEMMLDNEFEVRIALPGGAGDGTNRDAYVTDLDMMSLRRVEGVFSATEEERGPWIPDTSSATSAPRLMGQPALLLPEMTEEDFGGIDIDGLMSYRDEPYTTTTTTTTTTTNNTTTNYNNNRQDGLCV